MKYGDKIKYKYEHSLNYVSKTIIVKKGIFIRLINHKIPNYYGQFALVHFNGNKTDSRVLFDKLKKIKNE